MFSFLLVPLKQKNNTLNFFAFLSPVILFYSWEKKNEKIRIRKGWEANREVKEKKIFFFSFFNGNLVSFLAQFAHTLFFIFHKIEKKKELEKGNEF